jgi:hypothetical protein
MNRSQPEAPLLAALKTTAHSPSCCCPAKLHGLHRFDELLFLHIDIYNKKNAWRVCHSDDHGANPLCQLSLSCQVALTVWNLVYTHENECKTEAPGATLAGWCAAKLH